MSQTTNKFSRRTFTSSLLALAITSVTMMPPATANAAAWAHLGTRNVNGLIDFDQIRVPVAYGKFDKIRLRVRGNSLLVYDVKIHYRNGGIQDVPIRLLIPQGGKTRVIDLNGSRRWIKKVTFKYGKFANGRGRTFVDLFARQ